ncbi:flavodoxin [Clostridium polyendosporum]|uniref:Flavodoxin n=1 Tax=Clostridium polyendosporum TaxID=69208 RepID=A0A919VHB7_9CLOT|nr:flavodoxin [Clostridium polyendosporum]GIM29521.1 flavodoxin [Clostridium polyendosporum]
MKNVSIIYWSGTGNTEEMAKLIEQGLKENSANPKLINVSDAKLKDVADADLVILGSPSMGDEVIEETEMDPFVESIKEAVNGKALALFGSYGWGTGEWMINWEERMRNYGANLLEEGLIVNGLPEGNDVERCIELGRKLA